MGIKEGALYERTLIVKFLRDCQGIHEANNLAGKDKTASKHHADACRYAADAIEEGAHKLSA
jgi:hypothetical protein